MDSLNLPKLSPSSKAKLKKAEDERKRKFEALEKIDSMSLNTEDSLRSICRKVASEYSEFNEDQLRNKYFRWKDSGKKSHGNMRFDPDDENAFASLLVTMTTLYGSFRKAEFIEAVKAIKGLDPDIDLWKWLDGFLYRFKDVITVGKGKALKKERASIDKVDEVEEFCEVVLGLLDSIPFIDDLIFNFDESTLRVSQDDLSSSRLFLKGDHKRHTLWSQYWEHCAICPFVSTKGWIPLVVIMLPLKDKDKAKKVWVPPPSWNLRGNPEIFYVFTETGRMTNDAFKVILEEFTRIMDRLHPGRVKLLYMDRSCHMERSTIFEALDHMIHCVYFPPNTTHFLQTLDDLVFGNFKKVLLNKMEKQVVAHALKGEAQYLRLLAAAPEAFKIAATPQVIKKAWKNVGLFVPGVKPNGFDVESIMRNARRNSAQVEATNVPTTLQLGARYLLDQVRPPETENDVRLVEGRWKTNQIYTSWQMYDEEAKLLLEKEKREEEKLWKTTIAKVDAEIRKFEAMKKKSTAAANTCKSCKKKFDHKDGWMGCESCESFWMCSRCYQRDSSMMETHEDECCDD
jgi:hypothetical protein